MHRGRASGTFEYKITDNYAPKALGKVATVHWAVRGVHLSSKGLSGRLNVKVSGPRVVCPFTLKNKRLVPLLDVPGNS